MTTELYFEIRKYLRDIIRDTEWEGHLFAVGGCCRDELMGLPIKDVDMAVNLPTGGVRFAQWLHSRCLTLHEPVTFPNYGTAMLRLRAFPEDEIELVQTRKEKYTDRNRRNPETVFGTLTDDCLRRDLTINSLYYDITKGEFVDITGKGIDDIRRHIIRTPCDPDITYDDDPLRILRCIRFASRFGWAIEPETFEGMKRNKERLAIVTAERVHTELDKMLLCDHPEMALEMMRESGALEMILPELTAVADDDLLWSQTVRRVALLPPDITLRCATLLINTHNAETVAKTVLRRLRYSNEIIDSVAFLIRHSSIIKIVQPFSDAQLRKIQYLCQNRERMDALFALIDSGHAVTETASRPVPELLRRTDEMQSVGSDMFGYRLPVTGQDVMRIKSIPPGPQIKQWLDLLLNEAFVNPLRSNQDFLNILATTK